MPPGRGQANDTSAIGPAERGNRGSAGSYRGASLPPLIPLSNLPLIDRAALQAAPGLVAFAAARYAADHDVRHCISCHIPARLCLSWTVP